MGFYGYCFAGPDERMPPEDWESWSLPDTDELPAIPAAVGAPTAVTARVAPEPEPPLAAPGVTGLGGRSQAVLLAPVRASVLALQQALEAVLAESADDPAVTAEIAVLSRALSGLQAALLDRVEGVERAGTWALDGSVSLGTWLAGQTRMTREKAAETLRVARSLRTKPATRQDLADGAIRLEHVEHATRGLDKLAARLPEAPPEPALDERGRPLPVPPGQPDPADWQPPAQVLDETERALLSAARLLDARALGVEIRKRTAALAPHLRHREEADLRAARRFALSKDYDGGFSGRFRLTGEDGQLLQTAIEAWRRTDHSKGDTRTPTQRDADALIGLVRAGTEGGRLPAQHGVRPHLIVLVPFDVWADQQGEPSQPGGAAQGDSADRQARFFDGEPLLPATLARYACDSRLTRIVLDEQGLPLDVGRTHRTVTPAIFLAAAVRDGGCSIENCHAPPERCEAHHVRAVELGGDTSLINTRLLCKGSNGHHHQVHDQGRTLPLDDGQWIGPWGFTDPPDTPPPF